MTNETIADIVREMRSGKLSATVECENCGSEYEQRFSFDSLADRIEAAYLTQRVDDMSQAFEDGKQSVTDCNGLGIVKAVASEMLNTSMHDITAEVICGWGNRLCDAVDKAKGDNNGND